MVRLLWIGSDSALAALRLGNALSGVEIDNYGSFESASSMFRSQQYEAAVIIIKEVQPTTDREIDTFFRLRADLPLIICCESGSIDDVIHLTRLGAFHVFLSEIQPTKFMAQIERLRIAARFRAEIKPHASWRKLIIGQSRSMSQVCEVIELVAQRRSTVLISGETGTGKEVVAKAIHAASNRASQPLVSVNCTALPTSLVESELFGHAKGAFTGAHTSRLGRFEQAHRGTIFLDEIGDLPMDSQSKLLRVLQEQEFQRVGSSETIRVDIRVIAATNVDLQQAIRERRFREDLYYRLNVVPIHLPPLRDRGDDIPHLLRCFVERIRAEEYSRPKRLSEDAVEYLKACDWPGNVRQLENAVRRAFALSGDREVLTVNDFKLREFSPSNRVPEPSQPVEFSSDGINFNEVVSNLELAILNRALELSGGNKARAADLLGIKRTTLLAKIKALNYPRATCA